MTMPNFLIIGAPKAGTTALYHYLSQHPEIYMSPVKEPNFFAFEGQQPDFIGTGDKLAGTNKSIVNLEDYQALFNGVTQEKAIGEASTLYLYIPNTAQRIKHYVPDAKLIAILRHPVDRAYSHFLNLRRDGREWVTDFTQALAEEPNRIRDRWSPAWHYKQVSLYARQIERYFETFEPQHIKIYLYEEWREEPKEIIREILQFLEVDDTWLPDMAEKHNVSSFVQKNKNIYDFLNQENLIKSVLRKIIPAKIRQPMAAKAFRNNMELPAKLNPQLRQKLIPEFQEDILNLQKLLKRDLSSWLS